MSEPRKYKQWKPGDLQAPMLGDTSPEQAWMGTRGIGTAASGANKLSTAAAVTPTTTTTTTPATTATTAPGVLASATNSLTSMFSGISATTWLMIAAAGLLVAWLAKRHSKK